MGLFFTVVQELQLLYHVREERSGFAAWRSTARGISGIYKIRFLRILFQYTGHNSIVGETACKHTVRRGCFFVKQLRSGEGKEISYANYENYN
jgi:hypothetical protein